MLSKKKTIKNRNVCMQSYDYVKLECQIQKKYLFIDFSLIVYTYNLT